MTETIQERANVIEARLMLRHIRTLERAYYGDEQRYAYFSEFYGPLASGEKACDRPDGAKELGFLLRGCEKPIEEKGRRYAYRVVERRNAPTGRIGFVAEAISGADASGYSLVCEGWLASDATDHWSISDNSDLHHQHQCGEGAEDVSH